MTSSTPSTLPASRAKLPAPSSVLKIRGLRWWIVGLLFGAAVLNYVDRQTLSALAPTIQRDLAMDDRAYANIVNLFLVAYTIAYLVSGWLVDRLGTRLGMAIFVSWWSVANVLTAAAQGVQSLGFYRFLLGLGEAGVWPAASKAVSEWFPARERAFAIGLYTMGATVGATVAPYLVIPLATFAYDEATPWLANALGHGTGWRMAFIITGAAGLAWLLPWWLLYRQPRASKRITAGELQHIEEAGTPQPNPPRSRPDGTTPLQRGAQPSVAEIPSREGCPTGGVCGSETRWSWRRIFTSRIVWLLLLGRLLTDPVWYFYQFWFPKYLSAERGLSQDQLKITWIIYAAAGIGSLGGGWLSGLLVKRGQAAATSRLWIMLGCACLMPVSPLIARVAGTEAALALAALAVCAALASLINISAIVVDVIPKASLGTVFSVVAAGSTVGGILMNTLVAAMVSGPAKSAGGFLDQAIRGVLSPVLPLLEGHGYAQWFLLMAFLHPIAWLLLYCGGVHRRTA